MVILQVIYNRDTDQSRGFGFVTMSTVEEAEQAVEKFNRYVSFQLFFLSVYAATFYLERCRSFCFPLII